MYFFLTESLRNMDLKNNWKVTLGILTLSSVLMSSGYTMLIPFLPMYLIQDLGVDVAEVNWWSGLIFSITFLISGLMAPIWGAMADRKSRKLMAMRAAVCLAVSYFLGAFVQTPMQLFGMRALQGFSSGLWPATLAIMSAKAPSARLGLCLGVMQGGLTAGHVIGPFFGGAMAELFGMRTSFLVAAGGLTCIATMIFFFIDEPPKAPVAAKVESVQSKWRIHPTLKNPVIQRMLFAAAMVQLTVMMTQPVLPLYIAELQNSMDHIIFISGLVFSVVGISGIFASPLWGILGQSWGYRPVLYLSLVLGATFGWIQAVPFDLTQFTIWRFIGGIAFAGIFPAINAVLTQSTDPADRGRVFGYSYCAQQLGSVLGPILGGVMATYLTNQIVLGIAGALLYPVAAVLIFGRPKKRAPATGTPVKTPSDQSEP